jgi:CheY-like chemotaxis protein
MDESMPNMTGTEAFMEILEYEKINALSHTPVVTLSANVMSEDKKRFKEFGMDDFLAKPIDTNELERVFKKYLKST